MICPCACGADLADGLPEDDHRIGSVVPMRKCLACGSSRHFIEPTPEKGVPIYATDVDGRLVAELAELEDAIDVEPPSKGAFVVRAGVLLAVADELDGERVWRFLPPLAFR